MIGKAGVLQEMTPSKENPTPTDDSQESRMVTIMCDTDRIAPSSDPLRGISKLVPHTPLKNGSKANKERRKQSHSRVRKKEKEESKETKKCPQSWSYSQEDTCDEFDKAEQKLLQTFEFYHGSLPREDLTYLLHKNGDFLLRISEVDDLKCSTNSTSLEDVPKSSSAAKSVIAPAKRKDVMILSVAVNAKDQTEIKNLIIRKKNNQYYLVSKNKFDSVKELIKHYSNIKENASVMEPVRLVNPVGLQSWEFNHNDIDTGKVIGKGEYAVVHKGTLKSKEGAATAVAIKMAKHSKTIPKPMLRQMMQEARLMRGLSHKNVVKIYGIAVVEHPPFLLLELVEGGSLRRYLQKNASNISEELRLGFCLGAAKGLEYLHQVPVLHRDVAARNCLITNGLMVKISDFGLSKKGEVYTVKEHLKLPMKWLAPEVLKSLVFTRKSDVYSFGILIYEVFSNGEEPFSKVKNADARKMIVSGKFQDLPPSCPEKLRTFISQKIFVSEAKTRSSMEEIASFLVSIGAKESV